MNSLCKVLKRHISMSRILAARATQVPLPASSPIETGSVEPKLMYDGKLQTRIKVLKVLSVCTTSTILGCYSYAATNRGLTTTLAATGLIFLPFICSPGVIWWVFKRYITRMYYNPKDDTFTIYHYGILVGQEKLTFKKEDLVRCPGTNILNSFTVRGKPFFVNDEDLVDAESVYLYKRLIGLD